MRHYLLRSGWVASFLFAAVASQAAMVYLPTTTVSGVRDTNLPYNGLIQSFVTTAPWNPNDVFSPQVTGKVFVLAGNEIGFNAAGVVTDDVDPAFFLLPVGQVADFVYSYAEGARIGSLILSTVPDLAIDQWIQLFRPTPANGIGSSTPPTSLALQRRLGDYGGFLAAPIPAGTTLYLAVADFNHDDNSGAYTVTGVPEPSTFTAGCLAMAGLLMVWAFCKT